MGAVAARAEPWVTLSQVTALSEHLHESDAFRDRRRAALRAFEEVAIEPDPLYRKYGYSAGLELQGLEAIGSGRQVRPPPSEPHTVQILHDAAGTHIDLSPDLVRAGVRAVPLEHVAREADSAETFLRDIDPRSDRLSAMGLALMNRGYQLEVPDGLEPAVRLKDTTVLSDPREALSVRRAIRAGAGTRLLISEEVYSTGGDGQRQRFYGSSTDVDLAERAQAAYLSVHAPDLATVSVYVRTARAAAHARMGWVWAGFGGFRTKLRNHSVLPGTGSDLEDLQAFYGAHEQAYDSNVRITHVGTDTHGQSITRGVFRDNARGLSRGLVRIEKEARKTISYLSEHAMLLNRGARSDTIPVLEILCRDVKATHSSSVAPVDPERVFYLESRGIPATESIRMIGEGFLAHVLDRAPIAGLRESLYPLLSARWEGRPVDWSLPGSVGLPPLEFRGDSAGTDWRFDTKLR